MSIISKVRDAIRLAYQHRDDIKDVYHRLIVLETVVKQEQAERRTDREKLVARLEARDKR